MVFQIVMALIEAYQLPILDSCLKTSVTIGTARQVFCSSLFSFLVFFFLFFIFHFVVNSWNARCV